MSKSPYVVRAKMQLQSISDQGGQTNLAFGAVYSSDPESENKKFADATPCAYYNISISKTAPAHDRVLASYKQGSQYYVEIYEAPTPEWNFAWERYPTLNRVIIGKIGKDGDPFDMKFVDRTPPDRASDWNLKEYVKVAEDGTETVVARMSDYYTRPAIYWKDKVQE